MKRFPTAKELAAAPLSEVLKQWQGLGYNRRAKMLHAAAKELAARQIRSVEELEALPGVGPYTARAVAAFAWNDNVVFVETNIRTAVIHHFFSKRKKVSDREIERVLLDALPKGRVREWYSALMDYGAHLKRSGVKLNARSKHYTKQTAFAGSGREARGALVRQLALGSAAPSILFNLLGKKREAQMRQALADLLEEGLIVRRGGSYRLAE